LISTNTKENNYHVVITRIGIELGVSIREKNDGEESESEKNQEREKKSE